MTDLILLLTAAALLIAAVSTPEIYVAMPIAVAAGVILGIYVLRLLWWARWVRWRR